MKFPSLPTINFGSVGKPDFIPAELGTYVHSSYFYYLCSLRLSNCDLNVDAGFVFFLLLYFLF